MIFWTTHTHLQPAGSYPSYRIATSRNRRLNRENLGLWTAWAPIFLLAISVSSPPRALSSVLRVVLQLYAYTLADEQLLHRPYCSRPPSPKTAHDGALHRLGGLGVREESKRHPWMAPMSTFAPPSALDPTKGPLKMEPFNPIGLLRVREEENIRPFHRAIIDLGLLVDDLIVPSITTNAFTLHGDQEVLLDAPYRRKVAFLCYQTTADALAVPSSQVTPYTLEREAQFVKHLGEVEHRCGVTSHAAYAISGLSIPRSFVIRAVQRLLYFNECAARGDASLFPKSPEDPPINAARHSVHQLDQRGAGCVWARKSIVEASAFCNLNDRMEAYERREERVSQR
ncbi:hypothetical protein CONPUDRAFT_144260 [Coniophora puteana RWD-64-598 SS2]|uniref:Uncharacterized protein n=1 Tax=Coniophora puteana (strain RWD-64-598) TaxID=741705 RepID=A0A5M3MQS3_CONPW|nr:uncharacterized protein CONPUDRAFT_144260 [Coniophora puteana RWD-64-598 SS2]EIW81529.1 hypothetical protein CONPUDRAFT_144260 [Coniophora puteana RWD-64-598 SS2]